jgi:protein-disulfide isomerase
MSLIPVASESDHSWGAPQAPIVLVEYGDFQCPFCGLAYPIVKQIKNEMQAQVRVVFRHFPLAKIHPQAKIAAVAAESAGMQQKFWSLHDLLFENQKRLFNNALLAYASSIRLDLDKFQTDLFNEQLYQKVDDHFLSGIRSGVNRTPTFFINGLRYDGGWENDQLISYLQQIRGW